MVYQVYQYTTTNGSYATNTYNDKDLFEAMAWAGRTPQSWDVCGYALLCADVERYSDAGTSDWRVLYSSYSPGCPSEVLQNAFVDAIKKHITINNLPTHDPKDDEPRRVRRRVSSKMNKQFNN